MVLSNRANVYCDACHKLIIGRYIHFSDGSIYCKDCYESLPKCAKCKKPVISEDDFIDDLCINCYQKVPKCDICGKAIVGSYTRFIDNSITCDSCMKKYLKCERCGKPVVKYTKVRGKVLCKYCLANAPRCAVCNNPIIDLHWVINKEYICNYCYKIYERCDICGMPSQFLFTVHNHKICYECQQKTEKCSACGLPIIGKSYQYKNQSGIFCEECEKNAPHCDSCGRPVGLQYIRISDGRQLCLECQRSAVKTKEQLDYLVNISKKGLNELGLDLPFTINFRLISKDLLDNRVQSSGVLVADGKNLGLFERKEDKMNIYLESHTPLPIALGTVCHELAHAWLSANLENKEQSSLTREGFCEWVSYRILLRFGYEDQAELITERTDLYGRGFQKILSYEKEYGIDALLTWIKTAS